MAQEKDAARQREKEALARLLTLGYLETTRPLDELMEGLQRKDREVWLEPLLREGPLGGQGVRIAAGEASLEEVRAVHGRSKLLLKDARTKEDRQAALLGYFISVAAAIVHHRTLLTRRSRDELDPLFLELAGALPAPWSDLLARAIERD